MRRWMRRTVAAAAAASRPPPQPRPRAARADGGQRRCDPRARDPSAYRYGRTAASGAADTIARVDAADPTEPLLGAVVLTQGRRPAELGAARSSLLAQRGVRLDVVVVGNGWAPGGLPAGVTRSVALPENVGLPAGRHDGVPAVPGTRGPRPAPTPRAPAGKGALLLFLDDDAALVDDGFLREVARRFDADP